MQSEEMMEEFRIEMAEIAQSLDEALLRWERDPSNPDLPERIFRQLHTLKGSSGFLELFDLSEMCHAAEDLISAMRKGRKFPFAVVLEQLTRAVSEARSILDQRIEAQEHPQLKERTRALRAVLEPGAAPPAHAPERSTAIPEGEVARVSPAPAAERETQPKEPVADDGDESAAGPVTPRRVSAIAPRYTTQRVRRPVQEPGRADGTRASSGRKGVRTTSTGGGNSSERLLSSSLLGNVSTPDSAALGPWSRERLEALNRGRTPDQLKAQAPGGFDHRGDGDGVRAEPERSLATGNEPEPLRGRRSPLGLELTGSPLSQEIDPLELLLAQDTPPRELNEALGLPTPPPINPAVLVGVLPPTPSASPASGTGPLGNRDGLEPGRFGETVSALLAQQPLVPESVTAGVRLSRPAGELARSSARSTGEFRVRVTGGGIRWEQTGVDAGRTDGKDGRGEGTGSPFDVDATSHPVSASLPTGSAPGAGGATRGTGASATDLRAEPPRRPTNPWIAEARSGEHRLPELRAQIGRAEPRQESRSEQWGEHRAEPRAEQRPEPRHEPRQEVRHEPRQEVRHEPRQEVRHEPRQEVRHDPRSELRGESGGEVRGSDLRLTLAPVGVGVAGAAGLTDEWDKRNFLTAPSIDGPGAMARPPAQSSEASLRVVLGAGADGHELSSSAHREHVGGAASALGGEHRGRAGAELSHRGEGAGHRAGEASEFVSTHGSANDALHRAGLSGESASLSVLDESGLFIERATTVRVDVARLDTLLNLMGDLLQEKHRQQRLIDELAATEEQTPTITAMVQSHRRFERLISDLQDAVLSTRMLPVQGVFRRYPRIVKDLAARLGKEVELTISGEQTELDRALLEGLFDPLIHLLRNSIDHGIEAPLERLRRNKNRRGTIGLSASQEGNQIVLEIKDDGRGIDPEEMVDRAIKLKLLNPDRAKELNDQEKIDLIFLAGFTSRPEVTETSGRGVGMSVVRDHLRRIGGLITVHSRQGEGTTLRIAMPLTLAILQVLLVRVKGAQYAIPLSSVVGAHRVEREQLTLYRGGWYLPRPGSMLPLYSLSTLLGLEPPHLPPNRCYLAEVGVAEKRYGVWVDGFDGIYESVIKSLEGSLTRLPGVAGGTFIGSGELVLVLDVGTLLEGQMARDSA